MIQNQSILWIINKDGSQKLEIFKIYKYPGPPRKTQTIKMHSLNGSLNTCYIN
jgi:hypothetical protein